MMDNIPYLAPVRNRSNMSNEEYEKARGDVFAYHSAGSISRRKISKILNVSEQFVRRYRKL